MPRPRPALVALLLVAATGCWGARGSAAPAASAPGSAGTTVDLPARDQQSARIEEVLLRKIPGLAIDRRPDGTYAIRIRGASAAAGDPLVLLDGIPLAGPAGSALADIDPQEVQRVQVIRDAASLSLYGARGANGVIAITTRLR